jgi:hypothetical protein
MLFQCFAVLSLFDAVLPCLTLFVVGTDLFLFLFFVVGSNLFLFSVSRFLLCCCFEHCCRNTPTFVVCLG